MLNCTRCVPFYAACTILLLTIHCLGRAHFHLNSCAILFHTSRESGFRPHLEVLTYLHHCPFTPFFKFLTQLLHHCYMGKINLHTSILLLLCCEVCHNLRFLWALATLPVSFKSGSAQQNIGFFCSK